MAITYRNIDTLFNDLVTALQQSGSKLTNFLPGSGLYTLSRAWISLLARTEVEFRDMVHSFYVQLATGDDLDRRVGDFGIRRKLGTSSSGRVTIIPQDNTIAVLPRGTLIQAQSGQNSYITEEEAVIGNRNTFDVRIRSIQPVSVSIPVGTRLRLTALGENTTVVVSETISGGLFDETDAELKARFQDFILSLQEGTYRAIRSRVLALPNIQKVLVLDQYPIQGAFTVVYDNELNDSSAFINSVRDRVEQVKPIGIPYQVIPVRVIPVSLRIRVTYRNSIVINEAEQDISRALELIQPKMGEPLLVSRITNVVLRANTGISDVVLINPTSNIVPNVFERVAISSFQIERVLLS